MTIYIITNLINNKKYIGITCRENVNRRWIEHKSQARLRKEQKASLINRAIKKYGEENFKFEIVEKYKDISIGELLQKESELITKIGSLAPNGYNIKSISEYSPATEKTKEACSVKNQGIKKGETSKFIGVYRAKDSFRFEIARYRKKYNKGALSEIEAAQGYDKMAIYFYGDEAKTNFPIGNYLREDVETFYKNFFVEDRTKRGSKYKFLFFDKRRSKYVARYKKTYIGERVSEEEAYALLQEYLKQYDEQDNH